MSNDNWICLDICNKYSRTEYYPRLCKHIKEIFNGAEVLVIGDLLDEEHLDNFFGSYIFVQCNDITPYRTKITQCKYIRSVLYSLESPTYLTSKEIKDMSDNWISTKKQQQQKLLYGDIVKFKTGVYKNLFGVVVDRVDDDNFTALLKFCKNYQLFQFNYINGEKINSMFDQIRVPKNG